MNLRCLKSSFVRRKTNAQQHSYEINLNFDKKKCTQNAQKPDLKPTDSHHVIYYIGIQVYIYYIYSNMFNVKMRQVQILSKRKSYPWNRKKKRSTSHDTCIVSLWRHEKKTKNQIATITGHSQRVQVFSVCASAWGMGRSLLCSYVFKAMHKAQRKKPTISWPFHCFECTPAAFVNWHHRLKK